MRRTELDYQCLKAYTGEYIHNTAKRAAKIAILERKPVDFVHNAIHDTVYPRKALSYLPAWQVLALTMASHLPSAIKSRVESRWNRPR